MRTQGADLMEEAGTGSLSCLGAPGLPLCRRTETANAHWVLALPQGLSAGKAWYRLTPPQQPLERGSRHFPGVGTLAGRL